MNNRRVVITGIGVTAPGASDKNSFLEMLQEGKSGIQYLSELEEYNLRCKIGGRAVFDKDKNVMVASYEGLTANFCQKIDAKYLIRGLRNASDFAYEKTISQMNHIVGDGIETIFIISQPQYSHISSSIVREIIKGKGNAAPFLPPEVEI